MISRTAQRAATAAALTITAAFALTACGGSSADGEYIGDLDGDLGIVTIEGSDIQAYKIYCGAEDMTFETAETNVEGVLDGEITRVTWNAASEVAPIHNVDYFIGDADSNNGTPVSLQGDQLTLGETVYIRSDSEQGEMIQQNYDQGCAD